MPRRPVPRSRPALGALGGLALLAGLWAALLMLGLHVLRPRPDFAEVHGPLMVLGFLGTLIALERAVPLDEPVGYLAPAAAGLGGVALTVWRPWSPEAWQTCCSTTLSRDLFPPTRRRPASQR